MMSAEVRSGAVMRKCDENATGFVPTPKTQFPRHIPRPSGGCGNVGFVMAINSHE